MCRSSQVPPKADPKVIGEWVNLVKETVLQFGIDPDDIYNFDETGFAYRRGSITVYI